GIDDGADDQDLKRHFQCFRKLKIATLLLSQLKASQYADNNRKAPAKIGYRSHERLYSTQIQRHGEKNGDTGIHTSVQNHYILFGGFECHIININLEIRFLY